MTTEQLNALLNAAFNAELRAHLKLMTLLEVCGTLHQTKPS